MDLCRRIRTALPCIAAIALVTAGAAAAAWPKLEPNASDQRLAKASVLHLSDFAQGSGWTAQKPGGSGSDAGMGVSACNGPTFSDEGRVLTGSASSSFQAPGMMVWSDAEVMKTVEMAHHDSLQLTDPTVITCMKALIQKGLPQGTQLISMKRLPFPRVGDLTVAYRALLSVALKTSSVRLQLDVVLVLSSRTEISLVEMAPFAISAAAKAGEVRIVQRLAGPSFAA